ncbi:hypothetical protein A9404_01940 [Halothiobacillus diazotrophicus]|uniref:Uncharacterized protein n=1 Tax=Halothiobacillus diazotrophicus TaxID=1860122 RepID=A0A191ZEK6_9GAMM|nr:hypothetical protein [Halothiobacillus diazotrophicus]ANJ66303.1 hypothetical protein A9404_01940 [Halothiobacillus diazotrophicus]
MLLMHPSKLLGALILTAVPLASPAVHADIINWNLLYGDAPGVGGSLGTIFAPPLYTIVPAQIDGADHVVIRKRHRVYRHEAHWLIHESHPHRHPHAQSDDVHREIYRQPREAHERGED